MKTKLALFFGGISGEYAVSLRSAAAILRCLEAGPYEINRIGIDRNGRWLLTEATPALIEADRWQAGAFPCLLSPDRAMRGLWLFRPGEAVRRVVPDVLFPVLHGGYGENGSMQGLFALSGIPYIGSGTEASAVGMNKALCKLAVRELGIPVVPWVALQGAVLARPEEAQLLAESRLSYPMFLKPARGGSSIGAGRVTRGAEFATALACAAAEDDCVLAEACLSAREIEIAVLQTRDGIEVARPGEIIPPGGDFYSYRAKYEAGGAVLRDTAALSLPEEKRLRGYAARIFTALGCRGGARVDFFLCRRTGRLYFNEINTLPGFTEGSMFPRLLTQGRSVAELLHELIAGAAV